MNRFGDSDLLRLSPAALRSFVHISVARGARIDGGYQFHRSKLLLECLRSFEYISIHKSRILYDEFLSCKGGFCAVLFTKDLHVCQPVSSFNCVRLLRADANQLYSYFMKMTIVLAVTLLSSPFSVSFISFSAYPLIRLSAATPENLY